MIPILHPYIEEIDEPIVGDFMVTDEFCYYVGEEEENYKVLQKCHILVGAGGCLKYAM